MTFEEYQREAVNFRTPESDNEEYLRLGLISEIGEVAGKLAKGIRDGNFDEKAFVKELGDVLWFVANLHDKRKLSLEIRGIPFFIANKYDVEIIQTMSTFAEFKSQLDFVVYCVRELARRRGYTLEDVMEINLAKLRDRQYRGVICGNGDER